MYTKNHCFHVPGFTKGAENRNENPELPEKKFFMDTRMSDRQGAPTLSKEDLGLPTGCLTTREASTNRRPHIRARGGKKRGVSDMAPSGNPASTRKWKNIQQAPKTSSTHPVNTPGPNPDPTPNHTENRLTPPVPPWTCAAKSPNSKPEPKSPPIKALRSL